MELSLPPAVARFPIQQGRLEAASRAGMKEPGVLGMLIGGSFASGEAGPLQRELSVGPADQARRVVLQALGQSP